MSPDLFFLVTLLMKMAVSAVFVVLASVITERAGPAIGALVSTLPVSAGPAFAFLSLDHDAAFIAESAISSLVITAATAIFVPVYCMVAQRRGVLACLAGAFVPWLVFAVSINTMRWTILGAVAANAVCFALGIVLSRPFRHARMPLLTRRWYDIPLRATMVAMLVATVVTISSRVGPLASGIIATFPVVFTSLILILQPRIGGPATAALIANTLWGLVGFGLALLLLHLAAVPLGAPAALSLALGVSICWNLSLWALRRNAARAVTRPSRPP